MSMLVAMGINEQEDDALPGVRFGRCRYFALFNSETNELTYIQNETYQDRGAGVKAARLLMRHNADVVFAENIGKKAFEMLSRDGIRVYRAAQHSITENTRQLTLDMLDELFEGNV